MLLGMEVGLGSGDFVFDGDPAPSRKKGTAPTQFLAHVYCAQTAGWITIPLGTVHAILCYRRGPSSPPCERGTAVRPPLFGPCLLWLWATVATIDMGQEEEGAVATVAYLSYC